MRDEFYKIYKDIFNYYYRYPINIHRYSPEYYILKELKDYLLMIDDHLLRPDARYFLLVNFHQLLIRPIIRSSYDINYEDFVNMLKNDIKMIINNTSRLSYDRPISAHQLIKKIDEMWAQLQTTKLELWG